ADSNPPASSERQASAEGANGGAHASANDEADDDSDSEHAAQQAFSRSEPPTMGNKSSSDVRALVSLAEATHPSVARSVSARRLRVTLITILVLAVLVLLFVIQMPR